MIKITTSVYFIFTFCLFSIMSCENAHSQFNNVASNTTQDFKDYWYAGEAELTRYALNQARYGEIHEGDAVLIFVTEDFRTDRQVKYEGGDKKNVASVLKLNFTRNFITGIYPYSMMSSVFTPVDAQKSTYKLTTTSQEWCGHTFMQLNLEKGKYKGQLNSYFQDEGDQEFSLDAALMEDEIWAKIRIDPSILPIGNIKLIPGSQYLRLKHRPTAVENATASLMDTKETDLSNKNLSIYRIEYSAFERVLEITFEKEFPFAIVAWKEEIESGFGPDKKKLITSAVRTHTIKSAYWSKHDVADKSLRKELGLEKK